MTLKQPSGSLIFLEPVRQFIDKVALLRKEMFFLYPLTDPLRYHNSESSSLSVESVIKVSLSLKFARR